jgi:hypothetical protein
MSTEAIGDSVQLDLSDSLRLYRQPVSLAQSVVQRQSVRFAPQSSSSGFNPTSNRQITIRMSSQSYIDPATAFLVFQYTNETVGQIPSDCILQMFDSAKLVCGGRTLESVSNVDCIMSQIYYGRTPAEAIRSGLGQLANMNKFNIEKGCYVNIDGAYIESTISASGAGTDVPGMDGSSTPNNVPLGNGTSSNATRKNTRQFATGLGHTACSAMQKVYMQDAAGVCDSGYLQGIAGTSARSRYFAIHLSAFFGLFSPTLSTYIPLRNCGILSIELTVGTRGVCNVIPLVADGLDQPGLSYNTDSGVLSKLTSGAQTYSLNNVFVYVDVCDANPGLVERIDELCASDSGVSLIYDTVSTSQYTVNYDSALSLQVARSYSHVRDLYCVLRPTGLANNSIFSRIDQTYYGSRMASYTSVIGSSSFPSVAIDSAQQAYIEFLKSFNHHKGHTGSVIDLQAYTGATGVHAHNVGWTGLLENIGVVKGGGQPALVQSTNTFAAPNTQFIIAQNYERVLSEGASNLSGISSRLAGSVMTLNLNLKPVDSNSQKATSVDCILGDAPIQVTIGVHCEMLMRIANSSILVAD